MIRSEGLDQERFDAALDEQFADDSEVRAAIADYFGVAGGVYTGSLFELMVSTDPHAFAAEDVVALSALSERVPPRVAHWLLGPEGRARTAALLRQVPVDVDIWDDDATPLLEPGGPLSELWDLLQRGCWPGETTANGMGTTRTSKLLAAKRPRLVPVWDGVVSAALPTSASWESMRRTLRDRDRRERIRRLTAAAPSHVSLLRRIDAVVWYRNRRQSGGNSVSAA